MTAKTPVVVLQLPGKLVFGSAQVFFREMESFLKGRRPRIVFDFSAVTHLDSAGVEMLLNSTEEVMKRNGDLKLAGLGRGPAAVLELTGVDQLFEIYEQTQDAVASFDQFPTYTFPAAQSGIAAPLVESGTAA